jgi:hypothetical protein
MAGFVLTKLKQRQIRIWGVVIWDCAPFFMAETPYGRRLAFENGTLKSYPE